jgi:hypothetical protein
MGSGAPRKSFTRPDVEGGFRPKGWDLFFFPIFFPCTKSFIAFGDSRASALTLRRKIV